MHKPKIDNWQDYAIETFYEIGHIKEIVEEIKHTQNELVKKNEDAHKAITDRLLVLEVSKKSTWSTIVNIGAVIAGIVGWMIALGFIKVR